MSDRRTLTVSQELPALLLPRLGHLRYVHNSDVLTPTTLHGKGVNFLQDSATLLMKTQPVASAGQELSGHEEA
jgi:hypothetical protein